MAGSRPTGSDISKRVLFVSYTSDWTGPTRSLQLLLAHLPPEIQAEVAMPARGPLAQDLRLRHIPVHTLKDLKRRRFVELLRVIRAGDFDVVYANTADGSARTALIASKLAGLPLICHLRGTGHPRNPKKLNYLRYVNSAIAVSEATATAHRRYLRQRPCRVIHNGIPGDGVPVSSSGAEVRLRKMTGAPPQSPIVVGVGNVSRRKNQVEVVRVLESLEESRCHMALFGRTDRELTYTRLLQEEIKRAGLEDRISLLGFMDDVSELLPGASVFLHTALDDPHPRAVLEAMRAGLPVVAYDVGGVSETVVHRETGLLAPAGDMKGLAAHLDRLLAQPEEARRLGSAGRQRVLDEFTARATATRVAAAIQEVVRARTGLGPGHSSGAR